MNYRDFVDSLDRPTDDGDLESQPQSKTQPDYAEIIVDAKTGLPRQAGADQPEGKYVVQWREKAERCLYTFTKGILKRGYLAPRLHLPTCQWLTRNPPRRKMLLLPREHCKTTIVGHSLPMHILIQPKERNIYFPGQPGADQRIYLIGEVLDRAQDALRVIRANFMSNRLFRALWPHLCWENPRRDSTKWNDSELNIPRSEEYPDPSIRAMGVGGAITGAHPTVLIKDDLTTLEAANSPTVMQTAIEWHIASRALINRVESLEFILGTRWAAFDLPQYVIDNDPTVEVTVRSIIEDGEMIYPEYFPPERIPELQKQFGPALFTLLYMNSTANPELTDFNMEETRRFQITDANKITFDEDPRDAFIAEAINPKQRPAPNDVRGMPLNKDTFDIIMGRGEWMRLKYG